MSAWRTALAGMLALAVLDAAVSSTAAGGRVGSLLQGVAAVVDHILSPTVAAIPDLRKHGGAALTLPPDTGAGSLIPPDWTTSPTAPATTPPSQLYI